MSGGIQSYRALLRERARRLRRLESLLLKSFIRGSVRVQGNRCGKQGCRCRRQENPLPHGPYPYLSYRGKKGNHSIFLTRNKKVHADKAIRNYKELMTTLIEISDIDFTILRYYHERLGRR